MAKVYLGPKVVDPVENLDAVTLAHNANLMKRRFTSSLHWYVNQSLTDLLEDYMLIDEHRDRKERQEILNHVVELPISFDETTRQLFVTQVLETIQREMGSSKSKCMDLIIGIFRRLDPKKSDVTGLLLKDFELLLDHVYFKDVKMKVEEKQEGSRKSRRSQKEPDGETVREAIGYTQILIKIFRLGFFRNKRVPILVVLNKLSQQKPSMFFANILFYILKEVGSCIIKDPKGGSGDRSYFFSTLEKETPTIDNVLQRVPAFCKFLPAQSENVTAVMRLIEDRRHAKRFPYVKVRTRSRSGSNGKMVTVNVNLDNYSPQSRSELFRANGGCGVGVGVTTVSAATNTENDENGVIEDQAPLNVSCTVGAEVAGKGRVEVQESEQEVRDNPSEIEVGNEKEVEPTE